MSGCDVESDLISVDQALALLLQHAQILPSECLDLNQALHRYLAEDIVATVDLPMFAQSAVDGYAICSESEADEPIAAQRTFTLIGEIRAGQAADWQLQPGQALRIFTGAKIPLGTTSIARQEVVKKLGTAQIQLTHAIQPHADIRDAGEEFKVGQYLASQGQHLSIGAIASLAMAGVQQVQVYAYPKITVLVTGDEVSKVVTDPQSGQVFDANAPLIQAWFAAQGRTLEIEHVADQYQVLQQRMAELSIDVDLIISTGGVSVGDYDLVRPVALDLGFEQVFWKVAQKPGKPLFFAVLQRADQRPCYLLGLAGNPAAVYVGMQLYAATLLHALQGRVTGPQWFSAVLQDEIKADARERFLRMSVQVDHASLKVKNLPQQQSHMLNNLMQANCLVRIPAAQAMSVGQIVQGLYIHD